MFLGMCVPDPTRNIAKYPAAALAVPSVIAYPIITGTGTSTSKVTRVFSRSDRNDPVATEMLATI